MNRRKKIGFCEQAINKGFPDDGTKGGMAARIDKMNKHITRRDSQKEEDRQRVSDFVAGIEAKK